MPISGLQWSSVAGHKKAFSMACSPAMQSINGVFDHQEGMLFAYLLDIPGRCYHVTEKITILKAWKIMKKNMFHLSPAIECEVVMQRREDKHEIIMLDSGVPSRELLLGPSPRVNRVKHCFNLSWNQWRNIRTRKNRCWHKNYLSKMGFESPWAILLDTRLASIQAISTECPSLFWRSSKYLSRIPRMIFRKEGRGTCVSQTGRTALHWTSLVIGFETSRVSINSFLQGTALERW